MPVKIGGNRAKVSGLRAWNAWSMTEDNLGNVLNEIVRRQHPPETAAVDH